MGARCFKSANDGSTDIYIPDREDTGYITEQGNHEEVQHADPSANENDPPSQSATASSAQKECTSPPTATASPAEEKRLAAINAAEEFAAAAAFFETLPVVPKVAPAAAAATTMSPAATTSPTAAAAAATTSPAASTSPAATAPPTVTTSPAAAASAPAAVNPSAAASPAASPEPRKKPRRKSISWSIDGMAVKNEDVEDYYEFTDDIGTGQYAQVFRAQKRSDGPDAIDIAVKLIDRKDTGADMQSVTDREIEVMLKIDHPSCVKLHEIYQTEDQVQLVMELMDGRDLFDRIITRQRYTEDNARKLMTQVCHGVKYLHTQNIIHRDLKPENILLCNADEDTECKVADFGLSKLFPEEAMDLQTQTLCGTPGYVAPEVLNRQPYGVKIDVWSLGIIAYITLCGFPPFPLDMASNSIEKVMNAQFTFPMPKWTGISEEAKDFISNMIVVDVDARMSMDEVLAHPWLANAGAQ